MNFRFDSLKVCYGFIYLCGDIIVYFPVFSDLDENLQKAFHNYLEVRGIELRTANFLHQYMAAKDSNEYIHWLKNLKNFVEH